MSQRNHHRCSRRGGLLRALLVCLVLAGIGGAAGYWFYFRPSDGLDATQLITQVAYRGPFDHIVLEQGEIESSSNKEIENEVQLRNRSSITILWVIPEGTRVKPGDKLVELDSAEFEQKRKEQKIQVILGESQVTNAEAMVKQAEISKEEYLKGVFRTEEKRILGEIAVAEQNRRKAELALESSERLVGKGLMKSLQLDADRYALANAQHQLDAKNAELDVLSNLTLEKMMVQFESDIDSAKAQLAAARSELEEERGDLAHVEDMIAKCTIYAPSEGVVVYANKYSSRGGSSEFVVEEGATVWTRQTIIRLPDPTKMQIKCKVNESRITLIKPGMPARIMVGALPGMELVGRVAKVNRYAEAGSYYTSSIKEYATFVEIIDPPEEIRTGMTAEVQIFVEQHDDAVQIPVEGLYEHGGEMYSLVQRGPEDYETVRVTIAATDDAMAAIESGISEDETVVLNLRQHLAMMDLPDVERDDNSRFRELGQVDVAAQDSPRGERSPAGQTQGGQDPAGSNEGEPSKRGAPSVNSMVQRTMESNDRDGDGTLSQKELQSVDPKWRDRIAKADVDGDGRLTRDELSKSMKQLFQNVGVVGQ